MGWGAWRHARPGPRGRRRRGRSSPWGPASVRPQGSCLIVRPFLFFSEEMPYLKCPLHTVLKLTPVAYGECGDAAPATPCFPGTVAPGGSRVDVACPLELEANLCPHPHAGCRVESIYLHVESVSTHRERSEVSALRLPPPSSILGGTLE